MTQQANEYLCVAMGVCIALLAVHLGDLAKYPAIILVCGLVLFSVRNPSSVLLSVLPLVYMIQPTPTALGWREICFAIVLVASTAGVVFREYDWLILAIRRWKIPVLLVVLILALNAATAHWHNVSLHDWLRGIVPFLFLLYAIPVWLAERSNTRFAEMWQLAAATTAGLFAWHVLQVYLSEELWLPSTFIVENGELVKMLRVNAEAMGKVVHEGYFRVTLRLQQATDVLLLLGVIWGAWVMIYSKTRMAWIAGGILAMFSTIAVVLTYTRSMILSIVLVVAPMALLALRRRIIKQTLLAILVLLVSSISTIHIFDLYPMYLKKLDGMKKQLTPINSNPDANITTRLEEYRIAYGLFKESPLVGQGLGIKHDIKFETHKGKFVEAKVGYVHNWIMYALMTGGLLGFTAYSVLLLGPAWLAWRNKAGKTPSSLVCATIAVMSLYALFFAVFRLIPFNLVLGGAWGLALASVDKDKEG